MNRDSDGATYAIWTAAGIVGLIFVVWLIGFVIAQVGARYTPQAGEVGVVRAGSSFWWVGDWTNGHGIKKVVPPGSGNTGIGLGSTVHAYPSSSSQRTYTITADPSRGDRPGVDVVEVSTSDGIRVGVEGTFYFNTAFDGSPQGEALARDFDGRFGVRTFPQVGSDCGGGTPCETHAFDGSDGWSAFLDANIRPIIDNDLRQAIGSVSCAQLVSSCALVYNQNANAVTNSSTQNQATLTAIQDKINQTLQADIKTVLGEDYFSNIRFLITGKPSLPGAIQNEIDKAQAQFAAVGTARAQVAQAKLTAQANEEKQKGYLACPACAQAAVLSAIPSNVTVYAPGANTAVPLK